MIPYRYLSGLTEQDRPGVFSVGAYGKLNITSHIKVSSTETSAIFGSLVYETPGARGRENVVVLNEIHIDIIEYIRPARRYGSAEQSECTVLIR